MTSEGLGMKKRSEGMTREGTPIRSVRKSGKFTLKLITCIYAASYTPMSYNVQGQKKCGVFAY